MLASGVLDKFQALYAIIAKKNPSSQIKDLENSIKSSHIVIVDDAIAKTTGERLRGPFECDVTLSIPPDSDALVCQRWPDRRGISRRTLGRLGANTHTHEHRHARTPVNINAD